MQAHEDKFNRVLTAENYLNYPGREAVRQVLLLGKDGSLLARNEFVLSRAQRQC